MRFQSTFQVLLPLSHFVSMKTHRKLGHTRLEATARPSDLAQQVLDTCAELPLMTGAPAFVRGYVADTVRTIFELDVVGMLVRDGATFLLDAVSGPPEQRIANSALISRARSFAVQAIERGEIVPFRLAGKPGNGKIHYGGVQPLVTAHAAAALVALRTAEFSADETSAFRTIGNVARMALENRELERFSSAQRQHLDQLLGISTQLASTSRLDAFLQKFVFRPPPFLGFFRPFVALPARTQSR